MPDNSNFSGLQYNTTLNCSKYCHAFTLVVIYLYDNKYTVCVCVICIIAVLVHCFVLCVSQIHYVVDLQDLSTLNLLLFYLYAFVVTHQNSEIHYNDLPHSSSMITCTLFVLCDAYYSDKFSLVPTSEAIQIYIDKLLLRVLTLREI